MKLGLRISLFAIVFAVGCGGRTVAMDDTADAGEQASQGGAAGGGGGSSSGFSSSGSSTSGGSSSGAGGASSGSSSGDPGSTSSSGSPGSSTSGGPALVIACGQTSCDVPTQECCITFSGGGGSSASETCAPQGQCQGIALSCSSAASCPAGQVCCADFESESAGATCKVSCGGAGGGPGSFGGAQLCASDAECTAPDRCVQGPIGLKACRPPRRGGGGGRGG